MAKKYNKEYFTKLREESARVYDNIPALNWGEMINGKYVMSNRYEFKWKYCSGISKHLAVLPTDLNTYITNFKEECEIGGRNVTAFLGTDSQNHLAFTRFVTVICLQVERNGVHVLVSRMDMPKIYDYRVRLLRETDISGEFARNNKQFFKGIGMPLQIHSDYNPQTNHKSSGVVAEATNYLKHLGFVMTIKPDGSWAASYAADHFC